ncbi:MAG: NAD+ synthase [Deltaproteobacteria bacterium]|nr:NAD+ synthase [Deltaproteobacteria bacterium]
MKIALAQVNPLVGDVAGNASLVRETIARAGGRGARLVIFPEMVVCGYPPRDLLERPALVERSEEAVRDLARATANGPAALVGHPARNEVDGQKPFLNAVSLLAGGRVQSRYVKRLLPSYDVFDEDRWFAAGDRPGIIDLEGRALGIAVCEDIWNHGTHVPRPLYAQDPLEDLAGAKISVILNPSASPFALGKPALREKMLADVARSVGSGVLFVNQVGGNDELVFDGGSLAVDAQGRTRARGPLFETSLLEVTLDEDGGLGGEASEWPQRREEMLRLAIVTGLRDYVRKCGFEDVVIGLSGGIDSALVACLAVDALGSRHLTAAAMPSRFSSQGSLTDARDLAGRLGIRLEEISIEPAFEAMLEMLAPHLEGSGSGLAQENLQARIRGTMLMALSNRHGSLVLATGNKSELAVGYCTLYGDMVGALAPIGDILKTDVYTLARHLNRGEEIIPSAIIDKAPSAELRPDQTDQDALPPYDELDLVLRQVLEQEPPQGADVSRDTQERVRAMVRAAEHKRLQAPIVLKVSSRAFGPGRRYPVAQGFRQ